MEQEGILNFWVKANELFEHLCVEGDKLWQKRKRILDTKLLVIFILKMVLSKNKQGYGISLNQLWDVCIEKGIALPQTNSVAASSLCEARQKLPESVFKTLSNELIKLWHKQRTTPTWNGHKVFAIDGSKINAPRGLLNYGYKIVKDTTRHYPAGMMSCMYNLQEQFVYDFEFVSHGDERECALEHLKKLNAGDIVVFDRGYFSYLLLYMIIDLKLNAVFRMQSGTVNREVASFWNSDKIDDVIQYSPSAPVKSDLRKRNYNLDFRLLTLRLVKHKIGNENYVYATTLLEEQKYPTACFADLYHGRWSIEELYKISKNFIDVEDFHSQTERGIKQELYGHLLLINIAKVFEADAKDILPPDYKQDDLPTKDHGSTLSSGTSFKINFKNCLSVVGRQLENLILASKHLIGTWLHKVLYAISRIRQRTRPGRNYPRISFKPRNRWTSFGRVARI
jgi:hypothetical protein